MQHYYIVTENEFVIPPVLRRSKFGLTYRRKARGFIRAFGVTAWDLETAKQLIAAKIPGGPPIDTFNGGTFEPVEAEQLECRTDYESIEKIASEDLYEFVHDDEDFAESLLQAPQLEGIWYQTGRGFYSDLKKDILDLVTRVFRRGK